MTDEDVTVREHVRKRPVRKPDNVIENVAPKTGPNIVDTKQVQEKAFDPAAKGVTVVSRTNPPAK